jgi:hypothetical protein
MSRALLKGIHRVTAQSFCQIAKNRRRPKVELSLDEHVPQKTGLDYILFRRESDPVAVSLRAGRPPGRSQLAIAREAATVWSKKKSSSAIQTAQTLNKDLTIVMPGSLCRPQVQGV